MKPALAVALFASLLISGCSLAELLVAAGRTPASLGQALSATPTPTAAPSPSAN